MGVVDVTFREGSARLSATERDALASYAAKASWPAGFMVYQRNAVADGIFLVLRGRIVLRSRVKGGRGYIPAMILAGETFGSEGLVPTAHYETDARADEPSETLHLSGSHFRLLMREQPPLALAIVGQAMAERTALLRRLHELATMSVEERLVAALVRLSSADNVVRDDGRLGLDAGQYRLLCELVAATRESVSIVLNRLIGAGLAQREGGMVYLAAPQVLASRADRGWSDGDIPVERVSDTRHASAL